jgi:hypothetical protein
MSTGSGTDKAPRALENADRLVRKVLEQAGREVESSKRAAGTLKT